MAPSSRSALSEPCPQNCYSKLNKWSVVFFYKGPKGPKFSTVAPGAPERHTKNTSLWNEGENVEPLSKISPSGLFHSMPSDFWVKMGQLIWERHRALSFGAYFVKILSITWIQYLLPAMLKP